MLLLVARIKPAVAGRWDILWVKVDVKLSRGIDSRPPQAPARDGRLFQPHITERRNVMEITV